MKFIISKAFELRPAPLQPTAPMRFVSTNGSSNRMSSARCASPQAEIGLKRAVFATFWMLSATFLGRQAEE